MGTKEQGPPGPTRDPARALATDQIASVFESELEAVHHPLMGDGLRIRVSASPSPATLWMFQDSSVVRVSSPAIKVTVYGWEGTIVRPDSVVFLVPEKMLQLEMNRNGRVN